MRKSIQKRMFTHAGRRNTEPQVLDQCPYYTRKQGCAFGVEVCDYNKGEPIPADCPMRSGSVTVIYYVEG